MNIHIWPIIIEADNLVVSTGNGLASWAKDFVIFTVACNVM